jgi:RNA polymerase sigma factor (sigma-70 family)
LRGRRRPLPVALRVKTHLETKALPLVTSRCACGASKHGGPKPDESRLIPALIAGDEQAWRELWLHYRPVMLRSITSVSSRFRRVLSADDEQEIFATLCIRLLEDDRRRLAAFDPDRGCSLGTWLGMLAVRTAHDVLRQRRRESQRDHLAVLDAAPAAGPDPYEQCLERERVEIVQRLLTSCSDRDRQFFDQISADAFDPNAIAQQLGIAVTTVYTKKHKLVGRLSRLAEQGARAA